MRSFLSRVLPYYRPYRFLVIVGILFVIGANAFQMMEPWVMRKAINGLQEHITRAWLWRYAGLILAVSIGAGFFRFLMRRTLIGVSRHVEYDLRQSVLRHLLTLEPAYYDHSRIGDLMTRSTLDIEQVRMVLGPALMYTMNTIFGFIFGISLMLMISVKLTLIVLLVAPLVSTVVFFMGKKVHNASYASQQAFSDLSAVVQENLAGIRVVKAFRQEEPQKGLFLDRSGRLKNRNLRLVLMQGAFMPSIMMVFGLAIAGILLLGGYLIIQGTLKVGDFVAFISYLMMLTWPMISVGWVVGLFQRGMASLRRINDILDRQPGIEDPDDPVDPDTREGSVRFRNVTFRYKGATRDALSDVDFKLDSGKTLGIVGRVGSGKSTIASLLSRLYEVSKGDIEVDGVEVRRWARDELRRRVVVVPQDPLLFSTSIRDNIVLGGDYSNEEVDRALQISQIVEDLAEFPHGLDTEVGERGITLSGGQKQRVAIARAVIRKPEVIIFDDALSAVDADTEERILENLEKYLQRRTAIVISHRITSVANADEILVLDDGRVVERGRHSALIKAKGVYAEIFQNQKMARELEDAA